MDRSITSPTCYTPGTPREYKFHGDFLFNTGQKKQLATLDYVLFASSLIVPILIGFYQALRTRCQIELEEYMLAKRQMGFLPVGLSMITTYVSVLTLIGAQTEVYTHNTMYIWYCLSFIIVCPPMAYLYYPIFYRLEIKSIYQYLELRFNRAVRTAAAFFFIIQTVTFIAIVLYIPSTSFKAISEINLWSVLMAAGLVCIIYVSLGGAKSVFYTDCFHVCSMAVGVLAFLVQAASVVGTQNMWESGTRMKRIEFFDFRLNPAVRHTVWGVFLGGGISALALNITQTQVQRCLACRSLKDVQIAIWMSFPGQVFFVITVTLIGLYMSAFYENCDLLHAKLVGNAHERSFVFMQDTLGNCPGLQGLFLAAIFGATLSTLSSGLNSIAMVVLEDFVRVFLKTRIHKNREQCILQAVSLFFGLVCLQLTSVAHMFGSALESAIRLNGLLTGPALGTFSLGMFFPWVNEKGALIGLFGGIAITKSMDWLSDVPFDIRPLHCVTNCNVSIVTNVSQVAYVNHQKNTIIAQGDGNVSYGFSYVWYSWIGCLSCITVGLLVSHFTGNKDPKDIDHRLFVPLIDVVFPFNYLPEEIRKYYRFGIDHGDEFNEGEAKASNSVRNDSIEKKSEEEISGETVIPAVRKVITSFSETEL